MTNMNVAITIWWKSILFNTLFTGLWAVFEMGISVVFIMILMIVFGYFITLPLLPLVALLVKLMGKIPYGKKETLCWLKAMLVMLVWIFYCLATLCFQSWPPDETFFYLVGISTSFAVLAGVHFSKNDLLNLRASSPGEALPQHKTVTYV